MKKHIPMRMCIACREMNAQDSLIRFVKDFKSGEVLLRTDKKLFGRSAYICKTKDCIKLAARKKGLERHFKCTVPHKLYEIAEDLI